MSANEMTVERVLRAHAPHASEALRTRVLAVEPRRTAPSRRLVLVLAVVLVVAVAAAVVRGFESSPATKPTSAPKAYSAAVGAATPSAASQVGRIAAQLGGKVRYGPKTVVVTVPAANARVALARLASVVTVVSHSAPSGGVVRIVLKLRP
jgi:hypothetical protein